MELRTPRAHTVDSLDGRFEPPPPEPSSEFTAEENSVIRIIASNMHRLNGSIARAVSAGLTVEITRSSRFHNESGDWGDQVVLNVSKKG
ncbi:MAG: hypothetical protein ACE5FR_12725 [Rhodospirillales bacterium]